MKIHNLIKVLFLFIPFFLIIDKAYSQNNKVNYSDIRIDALTDSKIRDFMNEVEVSGLNLDQIGEVALNRGMSPSEVVKLKIRVEKIRNEDARLLRESRLSLRYQDSTKRIGIDTLTGLKRAEVENESERALSTLKAKIFGSGIFRNSQLTFEPNYNIATPRNYRVAPNDELIVDIFGLSEANYMRTVRPDGTISIPYAGVLQVSGLSLDEIDKKLSSKLSTIYTGIKNGTTYVKVTTGKLRSIKVTLLGAVTKPGTYTLSSASTVFAALYASGGPTENGSYRDIEIIRENKVIAKLDVYDFLLKGEQANNITLKDQDIIRIPIYRTRVEVTGEVKRPGIFETLEGESLDNVISFAGGFNDNAYQSRIKVFQNTSKERKLIDIAKEDFNTYFPKSGDKYIIEPILDRFENRVKIEGAVYRPGEYELEPGLSLKSLIQKAAGLKDNAFLDRGYINRVKNDGTPELISFNTNKILNSSDADISLKREDIVTIPSIFDLKDEYNVKIDGEVRNPGQFYYADKMTLEDLILQAGGLKEGASLSRIEIARRVSDSNKDLASAESAEIFQISIDENLNDKAKDFVLKPFDIVSVRKSEGYEIQRQVKIEGE
ncbi:MAG: SLBB domain-containing protein, partial [Bacteroidetes bacterium]|nr:SLBB domain-containing protein [Bacteroidota bacterium]